MPILVAADAAAGMAARVTADFERWLKRKANGASYGQLGPHVTFMSTPVGASAAAWIRDRFVNPTPPDVVCEHGTAMDVHCCGCHSGFLFDRNHECEPR